MDILNRSYEGISHAYHAGRAYSNRSAMIAASSRLRRTTDNLELAEEVLRPFEDAWEEEQNYFPRPKPILEQISYMIGKTFSFAGWSADIDVRAILERANRASQT